jgi:hypothetical protein
MRRSTSATSNTCRSTMGRSTSPWCHWRCVTCRIPPSAVAELARVLAVGGTLVVSDPHPMGGVLGGQAFYGGVGRGRTLSFVRNHRHSASIWLRAFAGAGLQVVDCAEATFTDEQIASDPSSAFHLGRSSSGGARATERVDLGASPHISAE